MSYISSFVNPGSGIHPYHAIGDARRVGLDALAVRVEEGLAGLEVELPGVPAAAEDPALHPVDQLMRRRGQHGAGDSSFRQLRALVRAAIANRVEAALAVDDADRSAVDVDSPQLTRWQLLDRADRDPQTRSP